MNVALKQLFDLLDHNPVDQNELVIYDGKQMTIKELNEKLKEDDSRSM